VRACAGADVAVVGWMQIEGVVASAVGPRIASSRRVAVETDDEVPAVYGVAVDGSKHVARAFAGVHHGVVETHPAPPSSVRQRPHHTIGLFHQRASAEGRDKHLTSAFYTCICRAHTAALPLVVSMGRAQVGLSAVWDLP